MSTLLTIIITAITTYSITVMAPIVRQQVKAFIHSKKRRKTTVKEIYEHNLEVIVERMNELQEQMDNVAKNSYRRETNRKNNIRREVRDYLKELQK